MGTAGWGRSRARMNWFVGGLEASDLVGGVASRRGRDGSGEGRMKGARVRIMDGEFVLSYVL